MWTLSIALLEEKPRNHKFVVNEWNNRSFKHCLLENNAKLRNLVLQEAEMPLRMVFNVEFIRILGNQVMFFEISFGVAFSIF